MAGLENCKIIIIQLTFIKNFLSGPLLVLVMKDVFDISWCRFIGIVNNHENHANIQKTCLNQLWYIPVLFVHELQVSQIQKSSSQKSLLTLTSSANPSSPLQKQVPTDPNLPATNFLKCNYTVAPSDNKSVIKLRKRNSHDL